MSTGYIGFSENRFGLSDALAIYLLQSLKEFSKYEVIRVTTQEQMQQCDILVGVGDVFSHEELRFSHYGEDFNETMSSLKILRSYKEKLSTAGLVFAVYGKEIMKQLNPEIYCPDENSNGPAYPVDFKHNYRRIYEYFIEVLDCFAWSEPVTCTTPEKEKLMDYFTKTSYELETALSARRTDYASIVDIYSGRMGNKFRETTTWFYTNYLPSYHALKTAFDEAALVDMSGCIVVCEQHLAHVTVQDLVERITSNLTVTPIKVLPKIMVIRSKDKYRVECLKYTKLDKSLYFPSSSVEIFKLQKDLVYISDDKSFAIMKTLDSAVQMAKALLVANENISKKQQASKKQQSETSAPSISCTVTSSAEVSIPRAPESVEPNPPPASNSTKSSKKKAMSSDSRDTAPIEVQYLGNPSASQSTQNYFFQVVSDYQSTEKLIDVDSLDSHPSSVSVSMISGQCSVTGLTKKLREKYPVYRTYSLAFKDSNGKLVELVANSTTQSAEFWTRAKNEEFYFADLEADRSFSSSPTDTYDDVSDFDQSSPRLAPLDCDVEDAAIGIDLDNWDVPELLAAAILILSEICELRIACITSPNCIVRLGPGANSYEDPMHRYSRKDQVTMHQLAFLKCKNRLSCCGIAFGIHGQASIDHILKAKFPDTAQKNHVFRRLYGRLIEPVDAGVNGRAGDQATSQSNGPSHHSLLSTKEAQTLERMVSNCLPKNGGNDLAKSEAEKISQFLTALHFTQRYYSKFVGCLYNEIST